MNTSSRTLRKKRKLLRARYRTTLGLIFTVVTLLVFLLGLIIPDRSFSDNENRSLQMRPRFSIQAFKDQSFQKSFDTYYADQFPLRDQWISMGFMGNYLLGKRVFSNVYIGKDSYLFEKPEMPVLQKLKDTASAINAFSESYPDVSTRVLVLPDSAMILGDKLPDGTVFRDQIADIRDFEGFLNGDITCVDGAQTLLDHSGEYIYYKTDHHWTSLGAMRVLEENYEALGIPSLAEYKAYSVTNTFKGTLASRSGDYLERDRIDVYAPDTDVQYYVSYPQTGTKMPSVYVPEMLDEKDQYTVFFGGNHSSVEINTTADNDRCLLVFKDSFANCFVPLLTPYYEKIVMIDPRYYYENLGTAMAGYGVTDVLYLYSADTLLKDSSLHDVLETAL